MKLPSASDNVVLTLLESLRLNSLTEAPDTDFFAMSRTVPEILPFRVCPKAKVAEKHKKKIKSLSLGAFILIKIKNSNNR